jgi:hypothetical protein
VTEKPYPFGPLLRLTVVVYGVLPFGSISGAEQRVGRASVPVIFDPVEDDDGLDGTPSVTRS